jgi:hypothetical protein
MDVFAAARSMPSNSARASPRWRHRHADPADLAPGHLVVGVVAGLGGQVERDRQAGLALREVAPVQRVAGLGRRVAGVGAHHPRPVGLLQPVVLGHANLLVAVSEFY